MEMHDVAAESVVAGGLMPESNAHVSLRYGCTLHPNSLQASGISHSLPLSEACILHKWLNGD